MAQQDEFLAREQSIRDGQIAEANKTGVVPPVVVTTKEPEAAPVTAAVEEEISVPKWRFDEVNKAYQELKTHPTPKAEVPDIEKLVDQKLAPLKVQMEVDQVLKKFEDFGEYAPKALDRIKNNPSLSLEEAYKLEKFDSVESKAKEVGKKEAYETIEKKSSLQTERSGRRVEEKSIDDLIRDKTVPLSELEKMLPHA